MFRQGRGLSVSRRAALVTAAGGVSLAIGNGGFGRANAQTVNQTTTYLLFQAGVNIQIVTQLLSAVTQAQTNEVYLAISTLGGEVAAGITAYNFLRGLPKQLTTHNIGNIDSIGNAIFLAGEKRFASAHATFMFHGVGRPVVQNTTLSTNGLVELLNANRADEKRIGDIIKGRTKLTLDQVTKFFQEAKTMDAAEALDVGIIDKVAEIQMPAGAHIVIQ
jgi:ATP-dependent protease ClpP protease subunit